MKVSVILTNYNHAAFLQRRINTILYQTYQDFELIILDDCSTDASHDIIEQYRTDPKVSNIVFNEVNSCSAFKQWNKGIGLAKGEWIWMAESDDWCENNFLEELMNGVKAHDNCVAAFAQSYCVDDDGKVKWQSAHTISEHVNGYTFFKERLVYGCTIFNASMAVFKRQYALTVPAAFTDFTQCGDWFFWINIVRNGDVYISSKLLNYYRNAAQSLTSRIYATGYNFIEELKMFQLLKQQHKEDTALIHHSVFNRYNSFSRKKERFTAADKNNVQQAFYAFFGGVISFQYFLLSERIRLLNRKIRLKAKVSFANGQEYKTGTV